MMLVASSGDPDTVSLCSKPQFLSRRGDARQNRALNAGGESRRYRLIPLNVLQLNVDDQSATQEKREDLAVTA